MTDEKLNECCAATHGIYIKGIMCLMHKSEAYGKLLLKQNYKQTVKQTMKQDAKQVEIFACALGLQLAKHLPYTADEVAAAVLELLQEKVCQLEENEEGQFLVQKRMVQDNALSEARSKAGSKGGSNSQAKNKEFASSFAKAKSEANTEYEYANETENDSVAISGKKKKSEKAEKHEIAPSVKMTEDEMQKLIQEHGKDLAQELVLHLSNYKQSSGKNYKSDYHAVLTWVVDAVAEKHKTNKNLQKNGSDQKNSGLFAGYTGRNAGINDAISSYFNAGNIDTAGADNYQSEV